MTNEHRFRGVMSDDYKLLRRAIPNFEALQALVADAVAAHAALATTGTVRVLDLGCGDGVTSHSILVRPTAVIVTALDSEANMVNQARDNLADFIRAGRCEVVLHDAVDYLRGQAASTFDVVASALALHNLDRDYRHMLHEEIFRVLKPGGLFANVDKIALNAAQRFEWLQKIVDQFFEILVPLGKLELLRQCVLHEVVDETPQRAISEDDVFRELHALGFNHVEIRGRHHIAALLSAHKPSAVIAKS